MSVRQVRVSIFLRFSTRNRPHTRPHRRSEGGSSVPDWQPPMPELTPPLTDPECTYAPAGVPDIEVLVDGVWRQGELRAWQRREDGWWATIQYRTSGGQYLETVPAGQIRPETQPDVRRGRLNS